VEPAVRAVIDESRAQVEEILAAAQPPRWDNLVVPLEALDHRLARAWAPVGHLNAVQNTEALRQAYNACLPLLSDYSSELGQHEGLFRAFERVLAEEGERLGPGSARSWRTRCGISASPGVALPPGPRARFRQIMQELSTLGAKFEENLLDATQAWRLEVHDEARLAGLPEDARERARQAARNRGLDGWALTLDFPCYHAVMCHARGPRAAARVLRGLGDPRLGARPDGGPLRQRPGHGGDPAPAARGRDHSRLRELRRAVAGDQDGVLGGRGRRLPRGPRAPQPHAAEAELEAVRQFAGQPLEAWDIAFWSERLREHAYEVSDEELRPYFPADRVMAGCSTRPRNCSASASCRAAWTPGTRRSASSASRMPTARCWASVHRPVCPRAEARRRVDGRVRGAGGSASETALPVAFLVCNFMPPVGDRPGLLSHDDVVTLFHEFGHCLHHLLTRVDWPSAAGINGVAWDAVELPSQFLENFAWHPTVIERLSGHYRSGEPLPRVCSSA
jgi:oligopeptidase A